MTVAELLARLATAAPDARVLVVRDPAWPYEHDVAGVLERRDIDADDRDAHWEADDVLLVAGPSVGFGPLEAWDPGAIRTRGPRG